MCDGQVVLHIWEDKHLGSPWGLADNTGSIFITMHELAEIHDSSQLVLDLCLALAETNMAFLSRGLDA
jgi:hypothetical protein